MDGGGRMMLLHGSTWKDLPGNAVGTIAERLAVVDYIRFCFVCRQWMHVVVSGRHLPKSPQTPWLMLPVDNDEIGFLDIFTGTTYKPRLSAAPISNSIDGAVGGLEVQRQHYQFPIIPTPSLVPPLANAPTMMTASITILQNKICNTLSFARAVDGSWTRITRLGIGEGGKPEFEVASLDPGCIYPMGKGGGVDCWDISKAELISRTTSQQLHGTPWRHSALYNKFLVATTSRLLLVYSYKFNVVHDDDEDDPCYDCYISKHACPGCLVFQLNNRTKEWERIQSLGGDAIFADDSTAVLVDAASLPEPRFRDGIILFRRTEDSYKVVISYLYKNNNDTNDLYTFPQRHQMFDKTLGWFMATLSW